MERAKQQLYDILKDHVPDNAVHYCLDLWMSIPFHFKVKGKRTTKLGDYRYDRRNGAHSITVNMDLNKYSFLITYIHEVAHLLTTERNGRNVPPHGSEWRVNFRELMQPVLSELVFPKDILAPLKKHMQNPKASTYADPALVSVLRDYDSQNGGLVPLSDLEEGDLFEFNNRQYQKLQLRRTRVLCLEVRSSRKYLISKLALVKGHA